MKIGLFWHSFLSGNMGVQALTIANIRIINAVASDLGIKPDFVIIGFDERDIPSRTSSDMEFFPVTVATTISPRGLPSAIRNIDIAIDIGGGDSFAEIYGAKRFAFLWYTKFLAIALRKPLLLAPQTIGPFTKLSYRTLASWVLSRSRCVIARDKQSLVVAKKLSSSDNTKVAIDVAFYLPYENRADERGGARPRIGVNVSGLLFFEAESGRNRFGLSYDYAEYTRRLLTQLRDMNAEIFIVPHATSTSDEGDDDGRISDRMAAEFPFVSRVPDFDGPCEAKSFISSLDFLVAGRMHACIAAFSTGVPVVPVAYSRKFSGLFDMVDYGHVLPTSGIDVEEAVSFTTDAIARSETLRGEITAGAQKVDSLMSAYRDELARVMMPYAKVKG